MQEKLVFNPDEGSKKYSFTIRGPYTKREITKTLSEKVGGRVHVTSLNRKSYKLFYVALSPEKEDILYRYINEMNATFKTKNPDFKLMEEKLDKIK